MTTSPTSSSPSALTPSPAAEHKRRLGAWGESVAARHLSRQGMILLDRNWRCDAGEIDLVLRDGRVLVVCEVKTRRTEAFGPPVAAVDAEKVARLRRLAARWLQAHQAQPDDVRIDVVGVLAPHDAEIQVVHVAGVG
jgi:putative endonuclease